MISVVRDHLLFMTKIPCTDHSVQKSLCGKHLHVPAECDQHGSDCQILHTQSHLHVNVPEYVTTVEYTCTLL